MANSSVGNDSNQERKAYSFSTWVVSDHDQMKIQNSFEFPNFKSSSLPISPSQASSPSSCNFSPSVLLDSPLSFSNSNICSSPTAGAFPGVVSNNEDTKHFDFSFHSQAWPWTGPSLENNSSSEQLFSGQQGTWTSNTSKKQTVLPTAFIGVKSEGDSTQNVSQKIASTPPNMQNSYSLQSNQIHFTQSSQFIRQQKRSDDGYKWRKYGHKQAKASENPRSYYKCTYPNCLKKKQVETNTDGEITEIVYKGSHNHPKPQPTRGSFLQSFQNPSFTTSEISIQSNDLLFNNSRKDSAEIPENSSASFGDDYFDQVSPISMSRDDDTNELGAKRWKGENEFEGLSASGSGTVQEPRIVVQTTSDIDILDDGYRWRKYGQKVVKGNSNPRSYYKCTYMGCPVRKHIERASNDLGAVITTYEGKHNHDVPAARGSGSYRSSSVDSNNKVSPVIRPLAISNPSNHGTNFLQSMSLPTTSSQYTLQMLQSPESLRFSGLCSSANPNMNQVQDMGNNFPLAKEGPTDGLFFDSFLN